MTPPPTSDDLPPRRDSLWAVLRQKAIEAYYLAEDFLPRPQNARAWLRILRLPNLLTVPGDLLAGFLLASAATAANWTQLLLLAVPAGLFLYSAGLVLNDLFDYAEDARERPQRPLPAQEISREAAAAAALVLLWIAAFLAAFFDALPIALPMILCIILYDVGLKKKPILGPLLMGASRAGNLLLGAAAAGGGTFAPAPLFGAAVLGLYVAGVTRLSRNETQPGAIFTPIHVGRLLRMLIPLQALFCIASIHRFPANLLGLALLPLLRLHRRLSSRFPPS
ncbi:MAG: UbiA family prenyltransferase [Kiritimatiellia bacterium]